MVVTNYGTASALFSTTVTATVEARRKLGEQDLCVDDFSAMDDSQRTKVGIAHMDAIYSLQSSPWLPLGPRILYLVSMGLLFQINQRKESLERCEHRRGRHFYRC
jgi:hypothetical protein